MALFRLRRVLGARGCRECCGRGRLVVWPALEALLHCLNGEWAREEESLAEVAVFALERV